MQRLDRIARNEKGPLDHLLLNPLAIHELGGLQQDEWQSQLVACEAQRILLLCSRQVGKSTTSAIVALRTAILEPPALVLVASPSERQSGEFINKVKSIYSLLTKPRKLGSSVLAKRDKETTEQDLDAAWAALPEKERESALQLHLTNGSRIIGLPSKPATILGYSSVSLLIIDEASRVHDDLYRAVRPMLAVSRGRLIALSTPFGKRGWFYEAWEGAGKWERIKVAATECKRISPEFLEEERQSLGVRWFRQEYMCSFEEAVDAVFATEDIMAAMREDVEPW